MTDQQDPLEERLIEVLYGSDTFALGTPHDSEYMKRLKALIRDEVRKARINELQHMLNGREVAEEYRITQKYINNRLGQLNNNTGGEES